jgi:Aldo/keto reductase family
VNIERSLQLPRRLHPFILLAAFLSTFSIGLISPILPALAERYGENAFTVGLLFSSYSFAQFLSAPILGAAIDLGINFLDTGDFYGMGHNELLIREAIKGVPRDKVLIAVKFGALRDCNSNFIGHDNRPVAVQNFLAYSLQRLGVDYIDLYYPARVDPNVWNLIHFR